MKTWRNFCSQACLMDLYGIIVSNSMFGFMVDIKVLIMNYNYVEMIIRVCISSCFTLVGHNGHVRCPKKCFKMQRLYSRLINLQLKPL